MILLTTGPIGKKLAAEWQELFDEAYGDRPVLKKALKRAYDKEQIPNAAHMKKLMEWIDKAKKGS